MNLRRTILILILFSLAISTTSGPEVLGEENNDVRQELRELRQMMEKMQKRIDDLEERNRTLEQQAKENEVERETVAERETEVTAEEPAQGGQGFLSRVIQTLNPEISVIGIITPAWYSRNHPFVFAENDPENTGVNVQEIEVGFQSVVDPYFRFDSFFSYGVEGVELEEAFGTTLFSLPLNSQFRIGRARAKFGRINQIHRHSQNFVTLPLVAAEFLGEHLNPTSIEANFLVPVPWYMELSASGGSPDVETPTFARDGNANNLANLLYIFHMANFFEPSDSLGISLGASFATGSNGTGDDERSNLYGADLFAKYRPLKNNPYQEVTVQSEFMWRQADTPGEKLEDYGFYSELVYRFAKRWNTGIRFGLTDTNTSVASEDGGEELISANSSDLISSRATNPEERLGLPGRAYRISPMLTFNPSEFSRIRFQYDYLNQSYAGNQHAIFLQFQYAIGAHGAHPY